MSRTTANRTATTTTASKEVKEVKDPENVTIEVKDGFLIMKADLHKTFGRSSKDKSTIVGTTHGFRRFTLNGKTFSYSVNVVLPDVKVQQETAGQSISLQELATMDAEKLAQILKLLRG